MFCYEDDNQREGVREQDLLTRKLLNSRSIMISGEINQELAQKVCAQLLILQEMGDEPIKLFINSQGGHVESGDTIHDMIKFIKPDVYIIGTGWVASAGVSIYLAADKDKRLSLPNTRYMIHQPLGGMQGQASDIEIHAREILKIKDRLNQIIHERTGQPLDKVVNDTDRDNYLSAEESVQYGLIDQVLTTRAEL